jgi:hypothetical protein
MQTLTYREVLSFLFVPLLYLLFIIAGISAGELYTQTKLVDPGKAGRISRSAFMICYVNLLEEDNDDGEGQELFHGHVRWYNICCFCCKICCSDEPVQRGREQDSQSILC